MKVTLLGTGGSAGLPQIGGADGRGDWGTVDPLEPKNQRTRTSIVLQAENGPTILVDTGPDLRTQLVNNGIARVDAILYTHAHADHVAGLDDIRILNRLNQAPMPVYGSSETLDELKRRFEYAFKPWNGRFFGRPALLPNIVEAGQTISIEGLEILVIHQDHGFGQSLGFRIGSFAYCTDVVRLDETALAALRGIKTWIVDCFTPTSDHPSHAGLKTVIDWVEQLRPEQTILTHMGPQMDYQTLKAQLPSVISPGYDGMIIKVNSNEA